MNRVLLASAASLVAVSAQAQSPVIATGSYVGQNSQDRAAIHTQSAYTAPQGRYGFSMQGFRTSQSVEFGGFETEGTLTGAMFSGFYGLTSKITLGGALPYMSAGSGDASVDGLGDAAVFGRMRAYRSAKGTTLAAVDAIVTLPTADEAIASTDAATYQVGGAVSHRHNRISFHVAPALRMVKDMDMSYDLNLAAAFAATPTMALSFEALNGFEGAESVDEADRTRFSALGAGLRYTGMENLAIDFGVRMDVSNSLPEGVDLSENRVNLGFSWLF